MSRYALDLADLQELSDLAGSLTPSQCGALADRAARRADDAQARVWSLLEQAEQAEQADDDPTRVPPAEYALMLREQAADLVALCVGQRNLCRYLQEREQEGDV